MGKVGKRSRKRSGFSLTEVLLAAILSGFILSILGELSVLLTITSLTTLTKTEGLAAARFALSRIETDVRHARAFGDLFAPPADRTTFPSPNNPLALVPPPYGWPQPPWKAMSLSDSVLVIQKPVFFEPSNANPGPAVLTGVPVVATVNGNRSENVMTIVYELVPDSENDGEFLLQVASFAGQGNYSSQLKVIHPPQTILKGITGPIRSANQSPSIFTYLLRSDPKQGFATTSNPSGPETDYIRGVSVDLEFKTQLKSTTSKTAERYRKYITLHTDAFARNNNQMILRNTK